MQLGGPLEPRWELRMDGLWVEMSVEYSVVASAASTAAHLVVAKAAT